MHIILQRLHCDSDMYSYFVIRRRTSNVTRVMLSNLRANYKYDCKEKTIKNAISQ